MRQKRDTYLEDDLTSTEVDSSSFADQIRKRRRVLPSLQPDPSITFQDFRAATVLKHPNFSFLGPASMAVYWLKIYLKSEPFAWVHHGNPSRQDRRKRTHFCHIPGQYLHPLNKNYQFIGKQESLSVQEVLERGTPGIHYAPSYVGVYNMIRQFGKFGLGDLGDIVLVGYEGPLLPPLVQT